MQTQIRLKHLLVHFFASIVCISVSIVNAAETHNYSSQNSESSQSNESSQNTGTEQSKGDDMETSVIYQYTDEYGTIHFTDEPRKGSKKVDVKPLTTTQLGVPSAPQKLQLPSTETKKNDVFAGYSSLTFVEPTNEGVIRNNSGMISLTASVTPPLSNGHKVRFFLDGKAINSLGNALSIRIDNADYGKHTASFIILDANDKLVDSSENIEFYLLNQINRNRQN